MRYDLVPGTVFPDYQLPDHTGTPRKLSELQGADPLILLFRVAISARRNTSSIWNLSRFIRKSLSHTPKLPRSLQMTTTPSRSSVRQWAPSGHSSPTPTERFR